MNKLVSKKRSTQFARQPSSPRENRVDGVPVIHLNVHQAMVTYAVSQRKTHLSQHMLVIV